VALLATLYAVSFGFNYGVDNHPVYLLQALRLIKPEILHQDWYASEAMQYHPVFSYLAAPLLLVSEKGWGIGLALTVSVMVTIVCWYLPMRRLVKTPQVAAPALAAVVALLLATKSESIAISYIFNDAFQPSTLGSVGLLLAIGPFLAGRWLWSGVFLAFSGLFHANYLVLNVAVFGLVHLLLGGDWRAMARRLLLQLGPSLVPLAVLAAPMLSTFGSGDTAQAQRILFQIRAPHHYFPRSFQTDLLPLLGWFVLGLASSTALPRSRALRRLQLWMIACGAVVWVPTLITSWTYVPRIAQLFVWRVAPYLDLAGQSLFCLAVVRCAFTARGWRSLKPQHWGMIGLALLAMCSGYALREERRVTQVLLALALVAGVGIAATALTRRLALQRRRRALADLRRPAWGALSVAVQGVVVCAAVAILSWPLSPLLASVPKRSTLLTGWPSAERELYAWARQHTPLEARFLIPPQEPSFRYFAERPVVVDWKSSPMLATDVIEWFDRIKAVTGRPNFANFRELEGYKDLNVAKVHALKAKYGFDYVVVHGAGARGLDAAFKLAYRNSRFSVYDVR
jgi:hypothetical protein